MKLNRIVLAACTSIAALAATTAQAAPIKYVFSAFIDLTLDGQSYLGVPLTLTGYGDTTQTTIAAGNVSFTPLTNLTADVTGYGVFPVPLDIRFFYNPTQMIAGFFDPASFQDILTFSGSAFANYDGNGPIPLGAVTFAGSNPISTPYGSALVTDASNASFGATAAAVPEPAAWALMIAGFGAIGGAMRRRSRLTITYA